MKRIIILLSLLAVSCSGNQFAELDELISRHEEIDRMIRHKTDSLRARFDAATTDSLRWECAEDLYDEWKHLNLDSCKRYSTLMMRYSGGDSSRVLRSKTTVVRDLTRMGKPDSAYVLFSSLVLPPDASKEDCYAYYYTADRLYSNLPILSRTEITNRICALSDEYLSRDSSAVKAHLLKIRALRMSGKYKEAIDYALAFPSESITTPYDLTLYYNALAMSYYDDSNMDKAIQYSIKSACIDLRNGINDYFSLYFLGRLLFSTDDKVRAARYMNRSVQDALAYNYLLGLRRSATSAAMMNEAIHDINRGRSIIFITGITLISLLLVISLFLLFITRKSLSRVQALNLKYLQSQNDLRDVSLIKDRMLGEYMELSSNYIYKVDESKSRYRKVLKEHGIDSLMAVFREPNFADTEYPNYWNNFDKIFLSIFPDFVESVNRLMQPAHAFVPDGPQSLNTELRILALIRLGITESKRIASILHISKGTVYTYSSIMRQNSISPDGFEDLVKGI